MNHLLKIQDFYYFCFMSSLQNAKLKMKSNNDLTKVKNNDF